MPDNNINKHSAIVNLNMTALFSFLKFFLNTFKRKPYLSASFCLCIIVLIIGLAYFTILSQSRPDSVLGLLLIQNEEGETNSKHSTIIEEYLFLAKNAASNKEWEKAKIFLETALNYESVKKKEKGQLKGLSYSIPIKDKLRIKRFINSFLLAASNGNINQLLNFYADKVSFYKAGNVDKGFIRKDKINFYNKWINCEYRLSDISKVIKINLYRTAVVFEYKFRVTNKKTKVWGNAINYFHLIKKDGSFFIVSEDQLITERNKESF